MNKGTKEKTIGGGCTGEVADCDGDAGDGEEAKVVEGAEIGDGRGEGRVPVDHRVLRLRGRSDVRVHRSPATSSAVSAAAMRRWY